MFSPYYAWSGRRDPEDHVCINVALYAPGIHRWTMTERGRTDLERSATHFRVGPSSLTWSDGRLTVDFDEIAVPLPPHQLLPKRVKGKITLVPSAITDTPHDIDAQGRQRWWPIAPTSAISVVFKAGGIPDWQGHGYLDSNWGELALEKSFERWDWARGVAPDGSAMILYDTERRDGSRGLLALKIGTDGKTGHFDAPSPAPLKSGFWGVKRFCHADKGVTPKIVATHEDGPFYMRSVVDTVLAGQKVTLMHESFSGRRFASPIVKAMLPFRMPRATFGGVAYFGVFLVPAALGVIIALAFFLSLAGFTGGHVARQ